MCEEFVAVMQVNLIQNICKYYAHFSFRTKLYTLHNPSGNG